ncbi:MAG TPA: MMPL family transporter [Casimicrobiaceae bacterium]|nr:MMPL family transporter [Casimicrobiaceae bacterium]
MRQLILRMVDLSARYAWAVVAVAVVVAVGAMLYVVDNFAMNTDTAQLVSPKLPWRQNEARFDRAFPHRADLIAVVIDGATPELAELASSALAKRLQERSENAFRAVWRPDGGPFFEREGLLFLPLDELKKTTEQLVEAQPLLGMLAADPTVRGVMTALSTMLVGVKEGQIRLETLATPLAALADALDSVNAGRQPAFSWQTLIGGRDASPRELRRFILVQPVLDYEALQPGARATETIRDAARELKLTDDPRVRVRLTGPVPLSDEEFATLAEGAAVNTIATLIAVIVLLWLALKSWRLIIAVFVSLVVGLVTTAAFGLWMFGTYNLISVAFAVLFVGLGVDFGIQFCVAYRNRRYGGDSLIEALRDAARDVGMAIALASTATAAAFYSFLPTEYVGVSELGVIAGTGMIIAFVGSVTLLPALIALSHPPGERAPIGFPLLASLDHFLARHGRGVLVALGLVVLASVALLPRVEFDFNPLHLRSPHTESVATLLDLMKNPETTPNTIDVLAPSIPAAHALAERLGALPEVDHVLTLESFVPEQQEDKLALIADTALLLDPVLNPALLPPPSDEDTRRSLESTATALEQLRAGSDVTGRTVAQRLAAELRKLAQGEAALRERASAALIPGLRLTLAQLRTALQAQPVTLQTLPAEVKRDWVATDGSVRLEVYPKGDANDNATLERFVAAVRGVAPDATGAPISIQESGRTIVRAFVQAGIWAFISITVLLAIALRRLVDVVLTLAPLFWAGVVTLGSCVVLGLPLNYENIIALPLLFGIGVAFNIYYVMARRAGRTNFLQSSLTRAVLFSALTTGTAFGSLWFSHHPGTASMGELLALSLACTLMAALIFLPALLKVTPRHRASGPAEPTGKSRQH